jgi:hypothetical protein
MKYPEAVHEIEITLQIGYYQQKIMIILLTLIKCMRKGRSC